MKRLYADDSADSRVKVGNRQAPLAAQTPAQSAGVFAFVRRKNIRRLLRSRGGVARVRANTYDAPLKPTDHAAHTERLGLMARRGVLPQ